MTSQSFSEFPAIQAKVPLEITVNPFQMDCYNYFVLRIKTDVVFTIREYTGHADMYMLVQDPAVSSIDEFILFTDFSGPYRAVVLDRTIREWFGYKTGRYYLCFYATTPFSAQISVNEFDY